MNSAWTFDSDHCRQVLGEMLDAYHDWLIQSGYSQSSTRVYCLQIKQFQAYIHFSGLMSDGIFSDSQEFQRVVGSYLAFYQQNGEVGPHSVNACVSAVSCFARFLGLKIPRIARHSARRHCPSVLLEEEQQSLIDIASAKGSHRDLALLLVLLRAGLEVQVVLGLNTTSVISVKDDTYLLPSGKGAKMIRLADDATTATMRWLEERECWVDGEDIGALWLNQRGGRLSISGLEYAIRSLGLQAHLWVTPQRIRSTYFFNSVQGAKGKDIKELSRETGIHVEKLRSYELPGVSVYPSIRE